MCGGIRGLDRGELQRATFGSANGNRTRILALKGLRANRCTIAPHFNKFSINATSVRWTRGERGHGATKLVMPGDKVALLRRWNTARFFSLRKFADRRCPRWPLPKWAPARKARVAREPSHQRTAPARCCAQDLRTNS